MFVDQTKIKDCSIEFYIVHVQPSFQNHGHIRDFPRPYLGLNTGPFPIQN